MRHRRFLSNLFLACFWTEHGLAGVNDQIQSAFEFSCGWFTLSPSIPCSNVCSEIYFTACTKFTSLVSAFDVIRLSSSATRSLVAGYVDVCNG